MTVKSEPVKPRDGMTIKIRSVLNGKYLGAEDQKSKDVSLDSQDSTTSTNWVLEGLGDDRDETYCLRSTFGTYLQPSQEKHLRDFKAKKVVLSYKATADTRWIIKAALHANDCTYRLQSDCGTTLQSGSYVTHSTSPHFHGSRELWTVTLSPQQDQAGAQAAKKFAEVAATRTLDPKWQTRYAEAAKSAPQKHTRRPRIDLLSHRAGVGKSTLANHLALEDFSTVSSGNRGTQEPVQRDVTIGGMQWSLRDVPGQSGTHGGHTDLTPKQFVARYLQESAPDAVMYVVQPSDIRADPKSGKTSPANKDLTAEIWKAHPFMPLLVVNTMGADKFDEQKAAEQDAQKRTLGVEYDASTPFFNVMVPWRASLAKGPLEQLQNYLQMNRGDSDFPDMLRYLGQPACGGSGNQTLAARIRIDKLVRGEVQEALKPWRSTGFKAANALWTFGSQTVLGFSVPFVGPALESISRNVSILLLMLRKVGLLSLAKAEPGAQGIKESQGASGDSLRSTEDVDNFLQQSSDKEPPELQRARKVVDDSALKLQQDNKLPKQADPAWNRKDHITSTGVKSTLEVLAVDSIIKGGGLAAEDVIASYLAAELGSLLAEMAAEALVSSVVPGVCGAVSATLSFGMLRKMVDKVEHLAITAHTAWLGNHVNTVWPQLSNGNMGKENQGNMQQSVPLV